MTRTPLPNRRLHETLKFTHWNLRYIAGLGRARPGAPISEVFLNCGKSGEQVQTLARDSAVILSLALQHGVTIDELRHALTRNADGSPSGPLGALLDLMQDETV